MTNLFHQAFAAARQDVLAGFTDNLMDALKLQGFTLEDFLATLASWAEKEPMYASVASTLQEASEEAKAAEEDLG
jgi:hypothetical protein